MLCCKNWVVNIRMRESIKEVTGIIWRRLDEALHDDISEMHRSRVDMIEFITYILHIRLSSRVMCVRPTSLSLHPVR